MKKLLLMATVFVSLYANATMNIKAVYQGPACHGDATGSISLVIDGGQAPYSYAWSNGASTPAINNLTAGSYSVTVNDNVGVVSVSTIIIGEPFALDVTPLVINASAPGASDGGVMLTVRGGTPDYSYAWSNSEVTKNISGLAAGDYSVTITDGNGCQIASTSTVAEMGNMNVGGNNSSSRVAPNPSTSGTVTQKPVVNVYPNPAINYFNIKTTNTEVVEYTVVNTNGEEVLKQQLSGSENRVDVSSLPTGSYLVKVKNAAGLTTTNLVIAK